MKVFRFDDICINSDIVEVHNITEYLQQRFDCRIIWAVSPMVHNLVGERVFPKIYTAMSDYRNFFKVDTCGLPQCKNEFVEIASHGLIHVDHRLLTKEEQYMSISISCSLLKSNIFVPPFNKWNKNTEAVCDELGVKLIRFEDGWLSMEHNRYNEEQQLWYLHHRDFNLEKVKQWVN